MDDLIDVEDSNGKSARVSKKRLARWPSLRKEFRPVPVKKAETAVKTPTGDKKKEK